MRFFTILCGLFLLIEVCFATNQCEQQYCIGVVDVGSTGSRFHIYSYDLQNNYPVNITERWAKKIKPGFSSLEPNKAIIDGYLTTLFADSPKANVPVYFYATAGMRLLSQTKQEQMYNLVNQWFTNHSQLKLEKAKTISGTEEGLFGWLATNYQLNRFDQPVSTMDMGGASVQIAFPINTYTASNAQDVQEFDLYGQHFKLYIHSFLGLGQNEVINQFLDSPACFSTNYPMPIGIVAQGSAYECKEEVAALMNTIHHVNQTIQPILQSNNNQDWYVMGGLVQLIKSPPFTYNNQFNNQTLLNQANTEICQQDWSTLNNEYQENDFLYNYCLISSYYYALIVDGYGLPPQQSLHYLNEDQAQDWTLGVVLYQPVK